ncbi:unnamed protein product [Nippostrongylus brasiliensis]|uniref:Guanine nucleotide-binding protein alpha-13 subunit (inferred by orthology to a C. elegans protein) n=1 Tax=Nippostrongylus brasiliensis TaxID=27835 RepID=A0A158QYY8_NIPBR|nr:unnamed protein product [Nippostrongylus brasiliensis]
MGCGTSSQVEQGGAPAAKVESNAAAGNDVAPAFVLTKLVRKKGEREGNTVACGAAESGKTTLLEQIRLLYKQNYSESEFMHRKAFIYNNILISIKKLINRMESTGTAYDNMDNAFSCFTMDICDAIQRVWKDAAVQKLYERRSEINLNDSSKYFLENLASINRLDFTPTPRDLIMSYVPTVGVQNVIFNVNDHYNQTMEEDPETNRLHDSLSLLKKISNEPKFQKTPMFVFLNEVDVFREKLPLMPLQDHLPEYTGSSVDDALDYVEGLARKSLDGRDDSLISICRCCMINTDEMNKILENAFKKIPKSA